VMLSKNNYLVAVLIQMIQKDGDRKEIFFYFKNIKISLIY
jgi:hypothetical protein